MPSPPEERLRTKRSGTSPTFDPRLAAAFGDVARRLRRDRNLAQDAFANAAGIDRSYYGKLERGERQPSLGMLLRIAATLQMPAAELVALTEARFKGQ